MYSYRFDESFIGVSIAIINHLMKSNLFTTYFFSSDGYDTMHLVCKAKCLFKYVFVRMRHVQARFFIYFQQLIEDNLFAEQ